jgi:hypothetical protein
MLPMLPMLPMLMKAEVEAGARAAAEVEAETGKFRGLIDRSIDSG